VLESYLKPKSMPSSLRVPFFEACAFVLAWLGRIEAVGRGHANVSWTRRVVGSPSAPSEAGHGREYINVPIVGQ